MLERPFVTRDQLAERPVVLPQHVDQLLGRSRFGESGEAAQVAEQARDVRAVPGQELLAVVAGDELGHLRRDEPGQLRALPLDRIDQARVRDRDRRLVGEGLDERDVVVGERLRFTADEDDDADQVVLDHDRHAEHRSVVLRRAAIGVFRVVMDVRDVDRLTLPRPPGRRPSFGREHADAVCPTQHPRPWCRAPPRAGARAREVQGAVVGPAEPLAGVDHLVENGLDSRAAGDGAKDTADCVLLRTEILELTSKLRIAGRLAAHSRSLSRLRHNAWTSANSSGLTLRSTDCGATVGPPIDLEEERCD